MNNNLFTYSFDNVNFELKEKVDFTWLKEMGYVFEVFSQQDSGNICFGVEQDGQKKFVKYAGVRTVEYEGEPAVAVMRLKRAIPLYYELKHSSLIEIECDFMIGAGYAAVFKWFDGECLHAHWSYPPPAKYTDPNSPFYKYRQLPIKKRLESLNSIFNFHVFIEEKNYVAIDFYDGSILYDFVNEETRICDIDLYERKPFFNNMGRLWGSSRFMSPEEFELGSEIDSRSNVYTLGAIAFGLLGGELDRTIEKWEANKELYKVAYTAVENDKRKRYQTVSEFYEAWNNTTSSS
ncbi:MAG TPA: serine/threonine protein kinase [Candidatus Paenibacillus intestinavium]|nr:serine/threonine protein kinase [Candidatus Paenibacillus intestinavium]